MQKNRYINTRMWRDNIFSNLNPNEKLLFLYLLTNPDTNIAGIYEIPLKQIALDVGLNKENIVKILKRFKEIDKIFYVDGWIFIKNFIKYQKVNPKIETGIEKVKKSIPENIYLKLQEIDSLLKPIYTPRRSSNYKNKNKNKNKNIIEQKNSTNFSESGIIFDFDNEIEKMRIGKYIWRKIIAEYWLIKKYSITTQEMFKSAQARDTKSSKSIAVYEFDDIIGCMNWLQETVTEYDWKLETVHKKIDFYLQNIKKDSVKIDKNNIRKELSKECGKCKEGYILMVNKKLYEEFLPCECIYSTIKKEKLDEIKKYIKENGFIKK